MDLPDGLSDSRIRAEIAKLMAETVKLGAEQSKLDAEAMKIAHEHWWLPFVAISTALGIGIAIGWLILA